MVATTVAGTAQHEITLDDDLLDATGALRHVGWSRGARLRYAPARVRAPRSRVKECEHYTVLSPDLSLNLTLAQLGVAGTAHVEVLTLADDHVADGMDLFIPRVPGLPFAPYVQDAFEKRTRRVRFEITPTSRSVEFCFEGKAPTRGRLTLSVPGPRDGLAVITPFTERDRFFYEYKVPDLRVEGWVEVAGRTHTLRAEDTYAILDWGRGAWPRHTRWLWGWAAGLSAGRRVSLNLGCGFGDMSAASENAIVVDGVLHKLGAVNWIYEPTQRTQQWRFRDDDGRVSLTFVPRRHRQWSMNLLLWSAHLDKVYGHYSGHVVLDDGTSINVDGIAGFAEEMRQRW